MSDIVKRLRIADIYDYADADKICKEAADEIERLRAENAKLAASNHAYLSDYQEARGEIEKLRAALQTAQRDALEEAAKWHDEQAKRWQNTYAKETLSGPDMQATRILCLERGGLHIESAAAIRALGEKE